MIIVVGQPGDPAPDRIARAAADAGGRVQFVSRVADDPAGDRLLLGLTAAGVGHVATLRQPPPASGLESADVELALRYLGDAGVLVLCAPDADLATTGAEAAGWSRATLVVTIPAGDPVPAGIPPGAVVLASPASDPEGAFAAVVGDLAARLDAGADPAAAFAATMADRPAWSPASDD